MNCLCMVYQTYTVKLEVRQMYGFYTDRILGLTFRVCWDKNIIKSLTYCSCFKNNSGYINLRGEGS